MSIFLINRKYILWSCIITVLLLLLRNVECSSSSHPHQKRRVAVSHNKILKNIKTQSGPISTKEADNNRNNGNGNGNRITVLCRVDPPDEYTLYQACKLADSIRKRTSQQAAEVRIFFFYTSNHIPKKIALRLADYGVTPVPVPRRSLPRKLPAPSKKMAVFDEPAAFRNTDVILFLDVDILVVGNLSSFITIQSITDGVVQAAPATECKFHELSSAYHFFNRTLNKKRPNQQQQQQQKSHCPNTYINSGVLIMNARTAQQWGQEWKKLTFQLASAGFGFFSDQLSVPETFIRTNFTLQPLPREMNWSPARHAIYQPSFSPIIIHHHRHKQSVNHFAKGLSISHHRPSSSSSSSFGSDGGDGTDNSSSSSSGRSHRRIYFPDFIIAGCAEADSHSLVMYLKEYLGICWNVKKEPNYFLRSKKDALRGYGKEKYQSEFKNCADGQLWGDGSVQLYWDESAPERIMRQAPHAKIIFLLRNPIDLVYSAWQHSLRDSRIITTTTTTTKNEEGEANKKPERFEQMILEELETMEKCLKKSDSTTTTSSSSSSSSSSSTTVCADKSIYFGPNYLWRGLYGKYLRAWKNWFPSSSLLLVNSDQLLYNTTVALNRISRFLGLRAKNFPDKIPTKLYNTGKHKKKRGYQRIMSLSDALRGNVTIAPISNNVREKLARFYKDYMELEQLGGSDFEAWPPEFSFK